MTERMNESGLLFSLYRLLLKRIPEQRMAMNMIKTWKII